MRLTTKIIKLYTELLPQRRSIEPVLGNLVFLHPKARKIVRRVTSPARIFGRKVHAKAQEALINRLAPYIGRHVFNYGRKGAAWAMVADTAADNLAQNPTVRRLARTVGLGRFLPRQEIQLDPRTLASYTAMASVGLLGALAAKAKLNKDASYEADSFLTQKGGSLMFGNIREMAIQLVMDELAKLGESRLQAELANGLITEEDIEAGVMTVAAELTEMNKIAGLDEEPDLEEATYLLLVKAGEAALQEELLAAFYEELLKEAEETVLNTANVAVEQMATDQANAAAVAAQNPAAPVDHPAANKMQDLTSGQSMAEIGLDSTVTKAVAEVLQAVAQAKTNEEKVAAIAAVAQKYQTMLANVGASAETIAAVVKAIQDAGSKQIQDANEVQIQDGKTAELIDELLNRFSW